MTAPRTSTTKRTLALVGAGVLVVAVAFVAVLVPLIKHGRDHQPPPSVTMSQ